MTNKTERVHKNTFFSHTHPDEGGRFAVSDQPPRHVVGSTPVPRYSAGAQWTQDRGPETPSLGFSVDELEPTGTYAEVEQLRVARDGTGHEFPLNASPGSEVSYSDTGQPYGVVSSETASLQKSPKRKKR
jgi:hypothetical protein